MHNDSWRIRGRGSDCALGGGGLLPTAGRPALLPAPGRRALGPMHGRRRRAGA